MRDPWDRPPLARQGNRSDRSLFESLGRALNAWEEIEISMSHLYAAFVIGDRFEPHASHAYGEDANFNQRAAKLVRAAKAHFMRHPSQPIEGEFCRLMRLVRGYSARRNDMAHAHVLPIHFVVMPDSAKEAIALTENPQWCLVPPHFRANKFTTARRPAYAFSSWEINEFRLVFWDMAHAISNLSLVVSLVRFPPSRGIRPRPDALPRKVRVPRIRQG